MQMHLKPPIQPVPGGGRTLLLLFVVPVNND